MCAIEDKKIGWEFQIMIIILHHNHNHVICSYFQKILLITGYAFEDKKIGWEEFQIMINPPPPPKAPTPHKVTEVFKFTSKSCSHGEGVFNPLENMSHFFFFFRKTVVLHPTVNNSLPNFDLFPPGRAEGDEPHGHLDTSS